MNIVGKIHHYLLLHSNKFSNELQHHFSLQNVLNVPFEKNLVSRTIKNDYLFSFFFFLVVCPECEQVICFECISQHQLIVNNQVQENFNQCKESWNLISEKSSKLFIDRICFSNVELFSSSCI